MKKILFTLLIGLSVASCKDWLDINQNPNTAQTVPAELVLPQAELALANAYCGTMYNHASFIVQYFDQGVGASNYKNFTQFDVSANSGNRSYEDIYNLCLENAEYMRTECAANEDWGNYLAATVLRVFALQAMVDQFGEVPYTEALQGADNTQPAYDNGDVIYAGILAELDEALNSVGSSKVTDDNLLFGDNSTDKWIKFAKALKLKLLMRQASVNWNGVKERVNALITENDFPTADVAFECWEDNGTKRNPWYTDAAIFFSKADHMAAMAYVNTLSASNDPRLGARFDIPAGGGAHRGGVPGYAYLTTDNPISKFSTPKFVATAPAYLLTIAEVEFFKAEAAFRNNETGTAKAAYEAAIDASFTQAGCIGSTTFYAPSAPYAWNGTLEQIALQKWISLGGVNGFESWCEVRRLGLPFSAATADQIVANPMQYQAGTLIHPKGAPAVLDGKILSRYYYPLTSTSKNSNAPASKPTSTKIFWQP